MLALSSVCLSRKLFIVGRYDHNITKFYAVLILLVYQIFQIAQAPLVPDLGIS